MVYSAQATPLELPNLEMVQLLAGSLKTAIVITDANLERPGPFITFVNQAFAEMSGYTAADLIGQSPRLLQKGIERQAQFKDVGRALKLGRPYYGVLKNVRANGEPYFCEVDIRPLTDRSGQIGGYIAFEREALRKKGRPAAQGLRRFKPKLPETIGEISGAFSEK